MGGTYEKLNRQLQVHNPKASEDLITTERLRRAYLSLLKGDNISMEDALRVCTEPDLSASEGDDTELVYEFQRQKAREAVVQGPTPNDHTIVFY